MERAVVAGERPRVRRGESNVVPTVKTLATETEKSHENGTGERVTKQGICGICPCIWSCLRTSGGSDGSGDAIPIVWMNPGVARRTASSIAGAPR